MLDIAVLQKTLGIVFNRPALLKQALVHSSYINENPGYTLGHNERLEFLGDAVLDFIVAERLFLDFPDLPEGEMTRLRAAIVRRDTLAGIAANIKLGEFLCLGKGEEASGGRSKALNLASALEAVIAAVYLDQGVTITQNVIFILFGSEWEKVTRLGLGIDYKSKLQVEMQSKYQLTPVYQLISESGPDHEKTFTVEVLAGGRALGRGTGKNKKLAETEAAKNALENIKKGFTV